MWICIRSAARDRRGGPEEHGPMTPFMLAVENLLDQGEAGLPVPSPSPRTETGRTRPVAAAADTHLVMRSQAEQLVSEANAVLRDLGEVISLVDDCGPGELAFTLGYRDRTIRVETVIAAGRALSRLIVEGEPGDEPRQLTTGDQMPPLVLNLIAGTPHS